MGRLTKAEIKTHHEALKLLEKDVLSNDEILYVFENYREDAAHINSMSGAFFTPFGLAYDLTLNIPFIYNKTIKIIDLCAGIGILSYAASRHGVDGSKCRSDITCIESNPDYVEIGKKLLPKATWICGDALDPELLKTLGHFDCAIANPPFGKIKSSFRKSYVSSEFEFMVIEAASKIADEGVFIVSQMNAPFVFSGLNKGRWLEAGRALDFETETGIGLDFNKGTDTEFYKKEWHFKPPTCEIVCCDFTQITGQLSII